jgi:hypothetical protein
LLHRHCADGKNNKAILAGVEQDNFVISRDGDKTIPEPLCLANSGNLDQNTFVINEDGALILAGVLPMAASSNIAGCEARHDSDPKQSRCETEDKPAR